MTYIPEGIAIATFNQWLDEAPQIDGKAPSVALKASMTREYWALFELWLKTNSLTTDPQEGDMGPGPCSYNMEPEINSDR